MRPYLLQTTGQPKWWGGSVFNETNKNVETIDDLIIISQQKGALRGAVGLGFLRMRTKHVVVSFSSIQMQDKKMIRPSAIKNSLMGVPEFGYNTIP